MKRPRSRRSYFSCGGTVLVCYDALADGDPGPLPPNPEHLYFAVDDLEATCNRCQTAGGRIERPIAVQPWGERSFYARDPFGNKICFVDEGTVFTGHRR